MAVAARAHTGEAEHRPLPLVLEPNLGGGDLEPPPRALQDRAHQLFYESLARFGMLGLGKQESIKFTLYEHCYEAVDAEQRLYRKVRG